MAEEPEDSAFIGTHLKSPLEMLPLHVDPVPGLLDVEPMAHIV